MASAIKKCGKCDKVVYPTEEIRCLDKSWHKGCFKCTSCGMTLNIKTAKGYEKLPYCNAHYPQPKATAVVDNPEMKRVQQLSGFQSNVTYHKDFNENKGKVTAVADDLATTRAKEQQRNVSQVDYTSKRKESASQVLAPDNHEEVKETKPVPQDIETSKPTIGRVADYDPLNNHRGSLARGYEPTLKILHPTKFTPDETSVPEPIVKAEPPPTHQDEVEVSPPPSAAHDEPQSNPSNETDSTKMKARATYAYTGLESDELTFEEDDIIVDCETIDDGWMKGRLEKNGKIGLLPSNYVEILP